MNVDSPFSLNIYIFFDKFLLILLITHRHLREIDRSWAVVGRLSLHNSHGTKYGGNGIHWPSMRFNGGRQHNYYCQQRQAGRANEESISLDVYAYTPLTSLIQQIFKQISSFIEFVPSGADHFGRKTFQFCI